MSEPTATTSLDGAGGVCPVCRTAPFPGEITTACTDCQAVHHWDCWEYNQGCGKYGCKSAPPAQKLEELEIPASFWGQTDKECPVCHQRIQAAALRCRFCGAMFESAQPVETWEFAQKQSISAQRRGVRTGGIWLLVLGVIPITAPLAALFGWLWYAKHSNVISTLPPQQAVLPKIGLMIAVCETVMMVFVGVVYSLLGIGT